MTNTSGSKGLLSGRLGLLIVAAVVVIGLMAFAVWLLLSFGVYTMRGEVSVFGGAFLYPDRLVFGTGGPCQGDQEVVLLRETDVDVQVKVVASSRPFFQGGPDCGGGIVEIQLSEPLGDRVVVDMHTGKIVSVESRVPFSLRPPPDWRIVEVPAWPNQPGFSLQLPPGWELNEFQGIDSYVGEVTGDGVRLTFDYGGFSWNLDLAANPPHRYSVLYRDVGGFEAKLLTSMVPGEGYTGVYFADLGGPSLNLVGEDLTPEQQETAFAVFGSIRLLGNEAGDTREADPPPPKAAPPQIDDPPSDTELIDLQAVADQYGISLQEAIDQYAWRDNFSLAVSKIREAAPATFAGAEIVDGAHAWVAFTESPPESALDIIAIFTSSHSGVSVEVRTVPGITEAELETAIPAVHYAVFKAPGVLNANTSFDSATRQIETIVVLESTASDSVLDDLQAIAEKRLIDVTRADILDSIAISVIRSEHEIIGGDD